MGLNTTGFERPRLTEIKADYDQRFTDALGPVNTSPDVCIGGNSCARIDKGR